MAAWWNHRTSAPTASSHWSSPSEVTSVPKPPASPHRPWRTGGAWSGLTPFSRLEPGLPPRLLQGPLGAQHGSLDSIRIKEMSHICTQAMLSQSPPELSEGGGSVGRAVWGPHAPAGGSFIIVASASLQGTAAANKRLA